MSSRLGDLLRYALVTTARESLPQENPEVLRTFAGLLWRLERRGRQERARVLEDEARRLLGCSAGIATTLAREAHDVSLQARLEELVLPRMDPALLHQYVRVDGALPEQGVVVFPRAGNPLLLIALLAWRRPGLVCMQRSPLDGARGRLRTAMARRFEHEQGRLPVLWEPAPSQLATHVAAGRMVALAFDDRFWPYQQPLPLMGRTALLSDTPWAVARQAEARVTPAFIHREQDKMWRVSFQAPVQPRLDVYLRERLEPWLNGHGAQYLGFCADCRLGVEAGPLFVEGL